MKLRTKDLVLLGSLGLILFAAKMVMAGLPNIEPVTLLVMAYTVTMGRKALYPIYVYAGLEICMWGLNLWSINYLYVWLVLYGLSRLFRNMRSSLGWAILAGGFGLLFGTLCVPVYFLSGGWAFGLSWWVSGIPFDLAHGAGNFVLALILFKPIREILERLLRHF